MSIFDGFKNPEIVRDDAIDNPTLTEDQVKVIENASDEEITAALEEASHQHEDAIFAVLDNVRWSAQQKLFLKAGAL